MRRAADRTEAAIRRHRRRVSQAPAHGPEIPILHRAQAGPGPDPDYEGDWAWTPPSGARKPGESIAACAERELYEETGLRVRPVPVEAGVARVSTAMEEQARSWAVFYAEVAPDVQVTLHDIEHDRFEWVPLDEALTRCRPATVAASIKHAATTLGFMPSFGP